MSDNKDLFYLYPEEESMDTARSEDCLNLDDVLEEETTHMVNVKQSNSDLLNKY